MREEREGLLSDTLLLTPIGSSHYGTKSITERRDGEKRSGDFAEFDKTVLDLIVDYTFDQLTARSINKNFNIIWHTRFARHVDRAITPDRNSEVAKVADKIMEKVIKPLTDLIQSQFESGQKCQQELRNLPYKLLVDAGKSTVVCIQSTLAPAIICYPSVFGMGLLFTLAGSSSWQPCVNTGHAVTTAWITAVVSVGIGSIFALRQCCFTHTESDERNYYYSVTPEEHGLSTCYRIIQHHNATTKHTKDAMRLLTNNKHFLLFQLANDERKKRLQQDVPPRIQLMR